jgi:aspartyl-tRNA(Asn)/glutamyl-tRNA(Gln) amidotransferase subunit B
MGELSRRLNAQELSIEHVPVSAGLLAALITRISDNTISNNAAKQVFDVLWAAGEIAGAQIAESYVDRAIADLAKVDEVIEAKGLKQMNDTGALEAIVDEIIAANAKNVAEFKAGNEKALNALVGQIMKASKGKANPQQVNELLRAKMA